MLVDSCFGVWTVSTVLQEGFKITSAVSPCSFIIISSPFFSLFSLTSACLFRERTEFASRQPPGSLEKPMGEASKGAAEKKKAGRREGGGSRAHLHLQCLMNDEDNDG